MYKLNLANLQTSESLMARFSIEIVLKLLKGISLPANSQQWMLQFHSHCNYFAPRSLFKCDQVNCAHYKGQWRRQSTSVQCSTVHCSVVHFAVLVSIPSKCDLHHLQRWCKIFRPGVNFALNMQCFVLNYLFCPSFAFFLCKISRKSRAKIIL